MRKHENRESHIQNSRQIALPKIKKFVEPRKTIKDAEIQICAWAVEHNKSAKNVEEYAKLSKIIFSDSEIARNLSLGRTKATAIVSCVLGETHNKQLTEVLTKNYFSLLIDESTDVSTKKTLVMVVRTHSWVDDTLTIRDYFYHVAEMIETDAKSIYSAIINKFVMDDIPYKKNLIGFAADGANVMFGSNNSVSVLLKMDCPNLVLIKCICHSFALCASYACKNIPPYVEQMCKDIYAFLSNSPLRTAKFVELQHLMDLKPLKMLHPAATRWLSLEMVVTRILDRFDSLKIYFSFQDTCVDGKQIQKMKEIQECLENPLTELYLNFLA
ncbi:uncharacterized protein LOC131439941 [Malaya genurostris]|uniref:uncharacterized protein LOC131439941 n=1 Tax=Malaya genurostris TaxID=325434 RepID=UPI0026F3999D|nr:uncharacterized protein LOC131439941 [Malaya genurostris]